MSMRTDIKHQTSMTSLVNGMYLGRIEGFTIVQKEDADITLIGPIDKGIDRLEPIQCKSGDQQDCVL